MKRLIPLVAAFTVSWCLADSFDDFAGMDTTSADARAFWTVSDHPLLENSSVEATLEAMDTVDARQFSYGRDEIESLNSCFFSFDYARFLSPLRSDEPQGVLFFIR